MSLILTLIVLAALAAVLGLAANRPDTFQIQREADIQAPPEKVHALLADFHRWEAWSPWEKLDPAMKKTHSGAASGRGAIYAWEGNGKAGAGRMEITRDTPPSGLTIQLDFFKPFKANNQADFTLEPRGGGTHVTWRMHGPSPFMSKVMGLFIDLDKMVGRDFEAGLANLKALAEH